jgi:hypothetical protein
VNLEQLNYFDKKNKILFYGWKFRANDLVKKQYEEIRKVFKISEEYQLILNNYFYKIDKTNKLLVGVHIRRGDYKTFENGIYYYTDEQYLTYMNAVAKELGKEIVFLICSNEKVNIDFFNTETTNAIAGPNHELLDMYALAACDYLIGPPSTFTMWASFYGNVPLYMMKDKSVTNLIAQNFKP